MYHRKYFEGTIDSSTAKTVEANAWFPRMTVFTNQTNILNEAIRSTLIECDCECTYDMDSCILTINGLPLLILPAATGSYSVFRPNNATAFVASANTTQVVLFSGLNYRFSITVKGDPSGILDVYIGAYQNPMATNPLFSIGKGKDLRNNAEILTVGNPAITNTSMYIYNKKDITFPSGINGTLTYVFGFVITNYPDLNSYGTKIVLINCIDQSGCFSLNNCYYGNGCLGIGQFYNIDGTVYYSKNNTTLVKCITPVNL